MAAGTLEAPVAEKVETAPSPISLTARAAKGIIDNVINTMGIVEAKAAQLNPLATTSGS